VPYVTDHLRCITGFFNSVSCYGAPLGKGPRPLQLPHPLTPVAATSPGPGPAVYSPSGSFQGPRGWCLPPFSPRSAVSHHVLRADHYYVRLGKPHAEHLLDVVVFNSNNL
jgi:hypothetical protein